MLKHNSQIIKKVYISNKDNPDIQVPFKNISQTPTSSTDQNIPNPDLMIYDTSGCLTDPEFKPSQKGIKKLRSSWVSGRSSKNKSQMHFARQGIITQEMQYVATRENAVLEQAKELNIESPYQSQLPHEINAEFVRQELAEGRAIIPSNINHTELEPMIIGKNFLVKVNSNIGNSSLSSSIDVKVQLTGRYGIRWMLYLIVERIG